MAIKKLAVGTILVTALHGCGLVPATPPAAPDAPFEQDFAVATDWAPVELVFPNGAVSLEAATLHLVEVRLRDYFALGVRPIDADAVAVLMPSGYETAERFRVLVTVTGGVNDGEAGSQFRVWVIRRDDGWSIDRNAEGRMFCRYGTGGFSGRLCVGG